MGQFKEYKWNTERILAPLGAATREQGVFAQEVATLKHSDRLNAHAQALAREVTATTSA